ncbi:cytochrome P450 [Agromyces archimandritae]|uniref:Cytochrome P450 n=1 Tax=Agromyces archimandritae TaxID=2781962 RepID=A0A975IN95_9MICO|nr:cytochrome P450 [Agromyces archimandritae]QTX04387.1 cytochrome P450 [Agromyces archimandritae]
MTAVVETELDLFSDEALADPYPLYRRIRDAAPAVRLDRYGVWALGRYEDVRAALNDWQTFTSAEGVALNPASRATTGGLIIATDPPYHDVLRGVLTEKLSPRALRVLRGGLEEQARVLVDAVVDRGEFDAVADLARAFPVQVVLELIGLPAQLADRALAWADAAFNAGGPDVPRTREAMPLLEDQFAYLAKMHKEDLVEGSFGWVIFDAADRGVIARDSVVPLMSAYVTAGLDTTINAISAGVRYFAEHPDQWRMLREDRSLIPSAFNEIVRMESPLQWFSRVTTRDVDVDGVVIPAGQRVLMLYGSANRDERKWGPDADAFDIRRDAMDHIAFGSGVHGCAGQGLARMEGAAVFSALADRVASFSVGEPRRRLNNRIRGLAELPTTVFVG